ncbi:MAG: protein-L-isoaspartate O-methyltransferase [Rhodocyclaceae bacterium]|nr:protein-L-isoaspartate O-methyltransferase [Rhodocyclaceae bacterium]
MNFEQARFNMIEQQLRPWEVLDAAVLDLLSLVKREEFVPPAWRNLAYADLEVPLGHGAAMLAPKVEARALQALGLRKREKVLEIGAGSGYFAALLAARAEHVWTVEIVPPLAEQARANLQRQGVANAVVETGDGARGWPAHAPYDAIVVSGALPVVPDAMLAQLKIGGRLFAVVGAAPAMTARLIVREAEHAYRSVGLFETQATPLQNAAPPARELI